METNGKDKGDKRDASGSPDRKVIFQIFKIQFCKMSSFENIRFWLVSPKFSQEKIDKSQKRLVVVSLKFQRKNWKFTSSIS